MIFHIPIYFLTYLMLWIFVVIRNPYSEHIVIEPEGAFEIIFTDEKTETQRLMILQTVAMADVCLWIQNTLKKCVYI